MKTPYKHDISAPDLSNNHTKPEQKGSWNRLSFAKLIANWHDSICPFIDYDDGNCDCAPKRKKILDEVEVVLTKAKLEGIKEGESTKNGVERYQMGYRDGNKDGLRRGRVKHHK